MRGRRPPAIPRNDAARAAAGGRLTPHDDHGSLAEPIPGLDDPLIGGGGGRLPRDRAATMAAAAARKELGARAEAAVAAHLAAQGLEILARNARVGRLEVDVIARDGPVVAIVEVRARGPGSYLRGLDSIDAKKRALVRRAGERLWRSRFSKVRGLERMRFDAAAVTFLPSGEALVEHVKAAF